MKNWNFGNLCYDVTLLDICSSPESEDDDYPQKSSYVFQKIAEPSETNPQTISQLDDSEHSYNDEEFLKSDVSSDCLYEQNTKKHLKMNRLMQKFCKKSLKMIYTRQVMMNKIHTQENTP